MLLTNLNMPRYRPLIGKRPMKTFRPSLGTISYYGNGHKKRPMKGGLDIKKGLKQVHSFLKKSKLISNVGPALVKQVPKSYKGIPTQAIASVLVKEAKRAGLGKRRKMPMMKGGKKNVALRKFNNTIRDIGRVLKKSKVISNVGAPAIQAFVPEQYKPVAEGLLTSVKALGFGRRKMVKKPMMKGGKNELRKFKNTMRDVSRVLKKSKLISNVATPAIQAFVPEQYKPIATGLLKSAQQLGYSRRRKMGCGRPMNHGVLRGGSRPLFAQPIQALTTRNLMRGGNQPIDRFVY